MMCLRIGKLRVLVCAASLFGIGLHAALAQPPPQPPQAVRSPREAVAIDLTGYWVSVVNEDWRWRMVTPPKGDYSSLPLNAQGRRVGDAWDPATDGSCMAYGAAALLRMPTRVRIDWDSDTILTLETDAGRQMRTLSFAAIAPPGRPTLQGHSVAEWQFTRPPPGGFGFAPPSGPRVQGGSLKVVTTNLSGGWLRRNGAPYSAEAVVTEYFDRFPSPNDEEWLVVTTIVDDPAYLNQPYITSSHFKREQDGSKWRPTGCVE
jgi:hypothetical protein